VGNDGAFKINQIAVGERLASPEIRTFSLISSKSFTLAVDSNTAG
jgi:hypothetical protein